MWLNYSAEEQITRVMFAGIVVGPRGEARSAAPGGPASACAARPLAVHRFFSGLVTAYFKYDQIISTIHHHYVVTVVSINVIKSSSSAVCHVLHAVLILTRSPRDILGHHADFVPSVKKIFYHNGGITNKYYNYRS